MIIKKIISGQLANNCFLAGTGKECVIIDASGRSEKILFEAKSLGFEPKALLITHGHFDHINCARALQAEGLPVYSHPNDDNKLSGNTVLRVGHPYEPVIEDYPLADGQKLKIAGLEISVLHTPGHSAGSCCFFINDSGLYNNEDTEKFLSLNPADNIFKEDYALFSGDTLFREGIGRTDVEPEDDYDTIISSITEKLLPLPPDTRVFCGHYEETTLGEEAGYFVDGIHTLAPPDNNYYRKRNY